LATLVSLTSARPMTRLEALWDEPGRSRGTRENCFCMSLREPQLILAAELLCLT
jgi:hypothetical protein